MFWRSSTGYQAASDKLADRLHRRRRDGQDYLAGCKDEAIVALCDLDHEYSAPVFNSILRPGYTRTSGEMFDKEAKNFDALIVATPDHWHSHLALAGLKMDKHIYCAKPITHTIAEARKVKAACLASRRTTKASIQDSRTSYARATTELLLTGAIGPDSRSRTSGPAPTAQRAGDDHEAQTPPEGMNWDQWCGPVPLPPISQDLPLRRSGAPWWDFGTGTVGDFGCHTLQMFHDELEMGAPDWVVARGARHSRWRAAWITRMHEHRQHGPVAHPRPREPSR